MKQAENVVSRNLAAGVPVNKMPEYARLVFEFMQECKPSDSQSQVEMPPEEIVIDVTQPPVPPAQYLPQLGQPGRSRQHQAQLPGVLQTHHHASWPRQIQIYNKNPEPDEAAADADADADETHSLQLSLQPEASRQHQGQGRAQHQGQGRAQHQGQGRAQLPPGALQNHRQASRQHQGFQIYKDPQADTADADETHSFQSSGGEDSSQEQGSHHLLFSLTEEFTSMLDELTETFSRGLESQQGQYNRNLQELLADPCASRSDFHHAQNYFESAVCQMHSDYASNIHSMYSDHCRRVQELSRGMIKENDSTMTSSWEVHCRIHNNNNGAAYTLYTLNDEHSYGKDN